jgi:hypothetical protein
MRKMYMTLGAALLCSGALMAQSAADKDQMDKGGMKDGAVTVTGCVAQGTDAAAKPDASKSEGTASYELDGGNLKPHLGHKVEVSGTMDKKGMDHSTMAKPDAGAKEPTGTSGQKDMTAGKINVKSVKMLAATCS